MSAKSVVENNAEVLKSVKAAWRKAKDEAKPVVEDVVAKPVVPESVSAETETAEAVHKTWGDQATEQLRAYRDALLRAAEDLDNPKASFTRKCVAYVLSICASFGAGYLVGMAINALLVTAMVSASLFLTIMVWVLGILLALYLGSRIGSAVYDGVVHETIENVCAGAWQSVTSWFTEKEVAA